MPEYAFHCRRCDESFSRTMHVEEHDKELPECPKCGRSDEVEKRITHFQTKTSRKSTGY